MEFLLALVVAGAVFFVADIVWLGVIAKSFYRNRLGKFLAPKMRGGAIVAFYAVYSFGVVWFAVAGATAWPDAALNGGVLGLCCYGTYNLTNLAILRNWPAAVAIADLVWGVAATAATATATFLIVETAV